jgi:hypothetical protein
VLRGWLFASRKGDEVKALVWRPVIISLHVVAGVLLLQRKGRSLKSCCSRANRYLFFLKIRENYLDYGACGRGGDRQLWRAGNSHALIMPGRRECRGFCGTGARLTHWHSRIGIIRTGGPWMSVFESKPF